MTYTEVNPEIINALKAQGYISCHLVLLDPVDPMQALVELIPGNQVDFELNLFMLDSSEMDDYTNANSPLTKYVINQNYLKKTSLD